MQYNPEIAALGSEMLDRSVRKYDVESDREAVASSGDASIEMRRRTVGNLIAALSQDVPLEDFQGLLRW
jgi:hypothetical protein